MQDRVGVREDHRVALGVNDPASRVDRLGDLVRVAGWDHPVADVEELPDPRLGGEVPDHPAAEGAGCGGDAGDRRRRRDQARADRAVGGEVVRSAV